MTSKKNIVMTQPITNDTPLALLTVGQLKELIQQPAESEKVNRIDTTGQTRYVYGLNGIADLFGCSIPTAARIKKSGKINDAITQIGRKIIVDADKALELAGKPEGGRK